MGKWKRGACSHSCFSLWEEVWWSHNLVLSLPLKMAAGEPDRRESEAADLRHNQDKQWHGASLFPREIPGTRGHILPLGSQLWRTGNSSKDLGRERAGEIANLHCHFSDSRGKLGRCGLFSSSEGLMLLRGSLSASCRLQSVTLVTLNPASAQIVLHALSSAEFKGWSCHWGNVPIPTFLR